MCKLSKECTCLFATTASGSFQALHRPSRATSLGSVANACGECTVQQCTRLPSVGNAPLNRAKHLPIVANAPLNSSNCPRLTQPLRINLIRHPRPIRGGALPPSLPSSPPPVLLCTFRPGSLSLSLSTCFSCSLAHRLGSASLCLPLPAPPPPPPLPTPLWLALLLSSEAPPPLTHPSSSSFLLLETSFLLLLPPPRDAREPNQRASNAR